MPQEYFEAYYFHAKTTIECLGLSKTFGSVHAVENLYLKIYNEQISVLLGAIHSGKSTVMRLLIGFLTPTSGTALIDGFDIRTDIDKVIKDLGWCPKENFISTDLTVQDNLYFFWKLKGLKDKKIVENSEKLLELLNLKNKKHTVVRHLSSHKLRLLCVAIAAGGTCKTLILDQPSIGLNLSSRRIMWDLLLRNKPGRF